MKPAFMSLADEDGKELTPRVPLEPPVENRKARFRAIFGPLPERWSSRFAMLFDADGRGIGKATHYSGTRIEGQMWRYVVDPKDIT